MMKAKDVMTRNPDCCVPEENLAKVIQLMDKDDCGIVPVIKDKASCELVGVITDRDISLCLGKLDKRPSELKLADCMVRSLVTVSPDESLDVVLNKMAQHQIRRVMVVESGRKLVGIIAQADMARHAAGQKEAGLKVEQTIEKISEPAVSGRR